MSHLVNTAGFLLLNFFIAYFADQIKPMSFPIALLFLFGIVITGIVAIWQLKKGISKIKKGG